ncbi:MAG TPA: hypothetical protein VF060_31205 [Trebonia sp.]
MAGAPSRDVARRHRSRDKELIANESGGKADPLEGETIACGQQPSVGQPGPAARPDPAERRFGGLPAFWEALAPAP